MPWRFARKPLGKDGHRTALESGFLGTEVDLCVSVRGLQADMTEPAADHVNLDAGFEQVNRRGVPKDVRRNASPTLSRVGVKARRVSADDLVNAEAG